MAEVLRMLTGEKWTDILGARQQTQALLTLLCAIGGMLLLVGVSAE
jgi:hypothetical protein